MQAGLEFDDLNPRADDYAAGVIDRILSRAVNAGASDIHLNQQAKSVSIRWRVNGRLIELGSVGDGESTSILGRIKALAGLVTYRHDIPQEGRLILRQQQLEARVGTLPTLHGERAVIRLTARQAAKWFPEDLGLPDNVLARLTAALDAPSGVLLITGPAGSGKTTTAYACLRSLTSHDQVRSMVTLEDPVETELPGVAQSQIDPGRGYHWSSGLKALLRQDPEIMLVGEIRDADTASLVFQAALTGQLVISTMHARSAADALRRLLDLGVPPYHLRSGLDLLLCQRLFPRICGCQKSTDSKVEEARCSVCGGSAVDGQLLFCEMLPPVEGALARAIVQDADSQQLQEAAESLGMHDLDTLVLAAIAAGEVSGVEVKRRL